MKKLIMVFIALFLIFEMPAYGAEFVCIAKDNKGKQFKGVGASLKDAEEDALNLCLEEALACKVVKCVQVLDFF